MHNHDKQNAILDFWFGDSALNPLANQALWFSKNQATDDIIRERFEGCLLDAESGAFDDWSKTANGALALVVLCDQFPRNIYRGDERSFAFDEKALRASQIAIAHDFDKKMNVVQRCFLYLPFEHSENIDVQSRSVELFKSLMDEAHGPERKFIEQALDFAVRHFEIIEKFGRFPHRNELLGRESTREESEFLKRPGSFF